MQLKSLIYLLIPGLLHAVNLFAQPADNPCRQQQAAFFTSLYFNWNAPPAQARLRKITLRNTASEEIRDALVIFKRRQSNYNSITDTFRLSYNDINGAYTFQDTITAAAGGEFEVIRDGYRKFAYTVNQLPQYFDLKFTLGRQGDVFVPVYNRMYALACPDEFLQFGAVYTSVSGIGKGIKINGGGAENTKHILQDSIMYKWLEKTSEEYNLGSIAGPRIPRPSVGFSQNYTIAYGLYLPKDEMKRQQVLSAIKSAGYKPTHLYYLADTTGYKSMRMLNTSLDFAFEKNTPDTVILQVLKENNFTAQGPIKSDGYYIYPNGYKIITAVYNDQLSLDILRHASAIITTPGGAYYNPSRSD